MSTLNQLSSLDSLIMRLTRIVFLFFLSQQSFLYNTNTAIVTMAAYFDFKQQVVIPSCKDHGIMGGETLDTDCIEYCYPNTTETFDYSDLDEDPNYVIRNTICRCFESGESQSAPTRKTFECTTKGEVWDKNTPLMTCFDNYNITSLTTCQNWCKTIDPKAYEYEGYSGSSRCNCGNVKVCNDNTSSAGTEIMIYTSSTAFALMAGSLMMTIWS
jgi:hypothetical protein